MSCGFLPDTVGLAWDYLQIVILGLPLFFVSGALRAVLNGEGDAKTPMIVMAGATALNLILDPISIFTLDMGIRGAAIATIIAQGLTLRAGQVLGVIPTTAPSEFVAEPVDVDAAIPTAMTNDARVQQLELMTASRRIDETVAARERLPQLDFTATFAPQGRSVDTFANPQTGADAIEGSWGEAFRNFITDDIKEHGLFAEYTVTGALDLTLGDPKSLGQG